MVPEQVLLLQVRVDLEVITAKWEIVKGFFKYEKGIYLNNRNQNVSHCLEVFYDRTVTIIKTNPLLNCDDTRDPYFHRGSSEI